MLFLDDCCILNPDATDLSIRKLWITEWYFNFRATSFSNFILLIVFNRSFHLLLAIILWSVWTFSSFWNGERNFLFYPGSCCIAYTWYLSVARPLENWMQWCLFFLCAWTEFTLTDRPRVLLLAFLLRCCYVPIPELRILINSRCLNSFWIFIFIWILFLSNFICFWFRLGLLKSLRLALLTRLILVDDEAKCLFFFFPLFEYLLLQGNHFLVNCGIFRNFVCLFECRKSRLDISFIPIHILKIGLSFAVKCLCIVIVKLESFLGTYDSLCLSI